MSNTIKLINDNKGFPLDNFRPLEIENYCVEHSSTPENLLSELEEYTKKNCELSEMLIGKLEASFLAQLIKLGRVKNILEIGCFTGYSALSMAMHLPDDGELITIDINETNQTIAKSFAKRSPHGDKITFKLGKALEVLESLTTKFQLIFIDADKVNYKNYLMKSLELLDTHGVIVLDNCLWSGRVLDSHDQTDSTRAIKEVNQYIQQRKDLFNTLLPIRDGMLMVQKV